MAWISDPGNFDATAQAQETYEASPYKNLGGEFTGQPHYHTGALELATNPLIGQMLQGIQADLGRDYEGIYRGIGRRAADTQTSAVSNALASSGRAGSIGAAVASGAQARGGAEMGAFSQGLQARQSVQDTALNASTFMTNSMLGLLTQKSGYMSNMLNFAAARKAANATEQAGLYQGIGAWLGSADKG